MTTSRSPASPRRTPPKSSPCSSSRAPGGLKKARFTGLTISLPFDFKSDTIALSRPDIVSARRAVWEFMSEDPFSTQGSGSFSAQTETPSTGEGPARPHRRRRRRRRRGGGRPPLANGGPEKLDELAVAGPQRAVGRVLFLPPRDKPPRRPVSAPLNYRPTP